MDHTPACQKTYLRAVAAIKDLLVNLKTAFPEATEFDSTIEKGIRFHAIGDIGFKIGNNGFRLRFTGIGKQGWSRITHWERYKVGVGCYGNLHDTQVFEKGGKLDYDKIVAVIKQRQEEFVSKETAEARAKTNREKGEEVAESLQSQIDEIRGYTRIDCQDDGSFKLTLTSLNESRLRAIVAALTIHHAK